MATQRFSVCYSVHPPANVITLVLYGECIPSSVSCFFEISLCGCVNNRRKYSQRVHVAIQSEGPPSPLIIFPLMCFSFIYVKL